METLQEIEEYVEDCFTEPLTTPLLDYYIQTALADLLDDVDSSMSTLQFRDSVLSAIEEKLPSEVAEAVAVIANYVGREAGAYCSGAPFDGGENANK